jgi:hypothetical protein
VNKFGGFVFALALTTLSARSLIAGPVHISFGNVLVSYRDVSGEDDQKVFGLNSFGTATHTYQGTALDPEVPIGNERGDSGVTYTLQDLANGAIFDVSLFHTNKGGEQRTLGGNVVFDMTFSTDRDLDFNFTADPTGPSSAFNAHFAGITQDLHVDNFGTTSGTLLDDGQPTTCPHHRGGGRQRPAVDRRRRLR